jgi:hypothetical protein
LKFYSLIQKIGSNGEEYDRLSRMIESNETDVDRNIKAICVTYGLRTEEKE